MFIGQKKKQQEKKKPNYGLRSVVGGTVGLAGLNQFRYAKLDPNVKKMREGLHYADSWLKNNEKKVNTPEDLSTLGLKNKPLDDKELKRAYRSAAKQSHPDMGGNADKFQRVNTAYENLKTGRTHTRSPELDKQYQEVLNNPDIKNARKSLKNINIAGKVGLGLGALGIGYGGYNAYKYLKNRNNAKKKNKQR